MLSYASVTKCERLEQENKRLRAAMQRFVDRVEAGEIRSRSTYREFKELLEPPQPDAGAREE